MYRLPSDVVLFINWRKSRWSASVSTRSLPPLAMGIALTRAITSVYHMRHKVEVGQRVAVIVVYADGKGLHDCVAFRQLFHL